jgi:hypothetical protein
MGILESHDPFENSDGCNDFAVTILCRFKQRVVSYASSNSGRRRATAAERQTTILACDRGVRTVDTCVSIRSSDLHAPGLLVFHEAKIERSRVEYA